ncbi:MAG: DUF29 family protein [Chromatiaceae bacterium]|nr:MAG: DUF29 family protein [Chromatiaceae bacterium]
MLLITRPHGITTVVTLGVEPVQATQNSDYCAWALEAAEHLRSGRLSEVDLNNVAQELEDMGKAQRHALSSHLEVLNCNRRRPPFQAADPKPSTKPLAWQLQT